MTESRKEWGTIFRKAVETAGRILILGHVHPDGDCVGSCLGMYNLLKTKYPGKEVKVILEEFPREFGFLAGAGQVSHDFTADVRADLLLCLDASDPARLGDGERFLKLVPHSLCVDHHITNPGYAEINLVEGGASSASELVASLFPMEEIPPEAAECLYLGLVHDTGIFRFSSTTEETMRLAGAFLSKGVNAAKIIDETFFRKTFVQNRILGQALLNARLYAGGRVIGTVLTSQDQQAFGAGKNDMDGIIDQLRITEGVEMAAFLYETKPGEFKISLRSNHDVDVSRIAGAYSGGGHRMAAGGAVAGDPWEVLERLSDMAASQLDTVPADPAALP